ncbi:LacI family DNA-binding transcriptional regulator [Horticoccus sp. 23ND18S-11]|uniref:LacI family DNA-binding transcriptional regulator n=1 Tax=Horticoccus sp. 23ND18S-11 TaxID=3391832 RepID=UPI0039C9BBCD
MPLPHTVVTLKQVAEAAGVSLACVSYALRHDSKISADTRQRVAAAAAHLGYRPNPRVASLMAHIRRRDPRTAGERIAFVWVHTSRTQSQRDPFLRQVFAGARHRLEQTGFAIEQFWTTDPGMTDARLEQILRTRGIVGVVLSPIVTGESALTLDWDWRHFAPAVIGNVTWTPELHHAGHHHYLALRMVLNELAQLGCTAPVALIEATSNERAKQAWSAAFLTSGGDFTAAAQRVRIVSGAGEPGLADWVAARRPDALIVSETSLLAAPRLAAWVRQHRIPTVTLYWSNSTPKGIGGVDQCYDRVAAHAVDLVVAQLNSNEFGVPDLPRIMLFPGRWVAPRIATGPTARPARSPKPSLAAGTATRPRRGASARSAA